MLYVDEILKTGSVKAENIPEWHLAPGGRVASPVFLDCGSCL